MRNAPENLTIAYMAKGAGVVLQGDVPSAVIDSYSGEIGLMESLIAPALLVDRVADYFDEHGGHPGVFQYEVSEKFGAAYMRALIGGADATAAPTILRGIMLDAGYDTVELRKAFADAGRNAEESA